jgi:hypothetical protein
MNSSRLVFALMAGCCLLAFSPLSADDTKPPFAMQKQYSADVVITMKEGMTVNSKAYVDGDKMRSDTSMNGMSFSAIIRKDKQKIYQLLNDQKMATESNFTIDQLKGGTGASFGPEGKFELIGPDTIDGVACTKYKVTPEKGSQVFDFWLDTAKKTPLQMAAEDGSIVVKWKNFTAGPQDAALFEVPADYKIMSNPGMPPGAPGGQ